jgi:uncharacterized phage protein gp47/JayE
VDLPSRLTLYALGRDYLLTRNSKIDPGQVDILGSDANIFVGSNSVVGYSLVRQLGYATSRLFLDGATGDDLDRLAFDRYGLTRKGASAALGAVQFTRPSFAAGPGTIPIGTILQTSTGVQYITTTAANFGATDLGPESANVRAVQAGKASQVGVNAIVQIVPTAGGPVFDNSIVVTNPLPTAGGEDAENDDTFRARIRNFWNTARRGVLSAIEFGATAVPGVVTAQAFEIFNGLGQPARIVALYIADSTGVASQALAQVVESSLLDYRAAGITVLVYTSLPYIVNIVLSLGFTTGVDTTTLSNTIMAAIVSFVNSLPVNSPLYLAQLNSVFARFVSQGLVPSDSTIASPTGDVFPTPGQTIRTTPANVSLAA